MNYGKRNRKTFIAGVNNAANHWVLVVVKLRPFKRINYCDTLAWDPPSNIHDLVNSYADHIPRVGGYGDNHLSTAHSPAALINLGNQCDWRCRNYLLQACSDTCTVTMLISAALGTLDKPLFQYLIGPQQKHSHLRF